MIGRKVHTAAALGNLLEALYWTGVSSVAPTPEHAQAAAESYIMAAENGLILCASYLPKKLEDKIATGYVFDLVLGVVNYGLSYIKEHVPDPSSGLLYPTRSFSRAWQPIINMVGMAGFDNDDEKSS